MFRYPFRVHQIAEALRMHLMSAEGERMDDLESALDVALALMEDDDRALEDYLANLGAGSPPVFDFTGPLVISVSDLYCPPSAPLAGKGILFTLRSASTSGTPQVGVFKNGASIGTAAIPVGSAKYVFPLVFNLATQIDDLQLRIVATGTGAAGLLGSVIT